MSPPSTAPTRLDDAINGAAIYYLTSLVMFLGFSLGLELFDLSRATGRRDAGFLGAFDRASARDYKQIA